MDESPCKCLRVYSTTSTNTYFLKSVSLQPPHKPRVSAAVPGTLHSVEGSRLSEKGREHIVQPRPDIFAHLL